MCFVCGEANPVGFRLKFHLDREKNQLHTSAVIRKEHQGYKDIAHGGILMILLDEAMVNLCWKLGLKAVTAEITVRLKKPVKVGERVRIEAGLQKQKGRALYTVSRVLDEKGDVVAQGEATCIQI